MAISKPSVFTRIKAKMELWAKILVKEEPQAEKAALGTIEYVLVPAASPILTIIAPEDVVLVAPAAELVESVLAALNVTIEDSGASPTVLSIVASVQTNIKQIENAVGLKSPKALGVTSLITSELGAISTALEGLIKPNTNTGATVNVTASAEEVKKAIDEIPQESNGA